MKYAFLPLLLLALHAAPALADDCRNAATQPDANTCSANNAINDDAQLNLAYRMVVRFFENNSKTDAGDPALQATDNAELRDLKAAEKAWIAYRDAECNFEAEGYAGGSIQPMIETNCQAALTVQQTKRLKSQLPN